MKRLLAPLNVGVGATRHLIWYLSYQITGETRDAARTPSSDASSQRTRLAGPAAEHLDSSRRFGFGRGG